MIEFVYKARVPKFPKPPLFEQWEIGRRKPISCFDFNETSMFQLSIHINFDTNLSFANPLKWTLKFKFLAGKPEIESFMK